MRMLKWNLLFCTLLAIATTAPSWSQSVASAFSPSRTLLVGAEYANFKAGFPNGSNTRLGGIGALAVYNFNAHLGIEGHFRAMNFGGWYGQSQRDLFAGPRYSFRNHGKWRPYASFGVGTVHIHYPFTLGNGDQFAFVPAGGVDYRLKRRWFLHAAYEYQFLPGSPNFTNATQYGIKPNGFTTGILFRVR